MKSKLLSIDEINAAKNKAYAAFYKKVRNEPDCYKQYAKFCREYRKKKRYTVNQ